MGNMGLDISVEELRRQHHEAVRFLAETTAKLEHIRGELKKANQRNHVMAVRMGIRLKALRHVRKACCPKPICDEDHGKGWCPIRRALERKPEENDEQPIQEDKEADHPQAGEDPAVPVR